MVSYWTNRPKSKKTGVHYKHTSTRHRLKELERFFTWLDVTNEFAWEKPRGYDSISRKITELAEDHEQSGVVTKQVYSPVQLAVINKHADGIERLLLYLGLNCAFGAAEAGRLTVDELLFNHEHEYSERLAFETTSEDSFIRLRRPKSSMFGEWLLWPETVKMLRWGVTRCQELRSVFVICKDDGEMLYNEKARNAQRPFASIWNDLVARARKSDSSLPKLPFGSLRDTLPDRIRHKYYDELASICLAHKTSYKADRLLDAYGNKPFGRLHTAIRQLREEYAPVFKAAEIQG
jgi:hypothetical protein